MIDHENAIDINPDHVRDKQRELLAQELSSKDCFGVTDFEVLIGEDLVFREMLIKLFDENMMNDDILALVDHLRARAIDGLGKRYEQLCYDIVSNAAFDRERELKYG